MHTHHCPAHQKPNGHCPESDAIMCSVLSCEACRVLQQSVFNTRACIRSIDHEKNYLEFFLVSSLPHFSSPAGGGSFARAQEATAAQRGGAALRKVARDGAAPASGNERQRRRQSCTHRYLQEAEHQWRCGRWTCRAGLSHQTSQVRHALINQSGLLQLVSC